jgi:hypothetical protein
MPRVTIRHDEHDCDHLRAGRGASAGAQALAGAAAAADGRPGGLDGASGWAGAARLVMRTLGASYSRTLRAGQEQHVVDTGPYRLVRHPGYAGSLLTWTGFALASRSTLVLALVAALLGGAYHHRIIAEEQLLQRDLPGYIAYSQHTKKTHPFRLVTAPSRVE